MKIDKSIEESTKRSGLKESVLGFLTIVAWLICVISVGHSLYRILAMLPFLWVGLWFVWKLTRCKETFRLYLIDLFLFPSVVHLAGVHTYNAIRSGKFTERGKL